MWSPTPRSCSNFAERGLQHGAACLGEEAGAGMPVTEAVDECGLLFGALGLRLEAAGPEVAAGRRIRGAGQVALEDDAVAFVPSGGIGNRDRGQQGLRV